MVPYIKFVLSDFCIYVFMLLVSFSILAEQQSLKIENQNNSTNTLTAEVSVIGLGSLEFSIYRNLPRLAGTNFHNPKPVQATEVLLYFRRLIFWFLIMLALQVVKKF